jgi:glycerol-3-phosphate dehydrogenase
MAQPNQDRQATLATIASIEFDVCVIGGGATGCGSALDAQTRGLRTVLLEAADFSSATSSASTKLIHGGVRYLQQAVTQLDAGQYHVVRRALRERIVMIANAPCLAHPMRFVIPCANWFQAFYYGLGMKLTSGSRAKPASSRPDSTLAPNSRSACPISMPGNLSAPSSMPTANSTMHDSI